MFSTQAIPQTITYDIHIPTTRMSYAARTALIPLSEGQPCPFLEVGGSRLRPRRSASQPFSMTRGSEFSGLRSTYFGSGTMEELARQLELLGRNTTNREQAQRKTGGKKQEVGGGNGLVEPVAVEEEAEAVSGDGKGGGSSAFSGNVGSESGSGGGGDEGVPRVPAFINEVLTPLQV